MVCKAKMSQSNFYSLTLISPQFVQTFESMLSEYVIPTSTILKYNKKILSTLKHPSNKYNFHFVVPV